MTATTPSLLSPFANLPIRLKVLSGFVCVLLILLAVSGIGYSAFLEVKTAFKGFGQRVDVVAIARDIDRNALELRRHVREYAVTGNEESVSAAQTAVTTLRRNIETGVATVRNPERQERLKAVQASFERYVADFAKVSAWKREQATLIKETLDPSGQTMRVDFEKLIAVAVKAGDKDVVDMATAGLQSLMQARLYTNKMLGRHDEESAQEAEHHFKDLRSKIRALDTATGEMSGRKEFDAIAGLAERYHTGFLRARDLSQQLDTLVNRDMRRDGDSIGDNVAHIRDTGIAEEHAIKAEADETLITSERLIIGLAVGGFLAGLMLAWVIGRAIASPIVGMTAVMKRIAGGDLTAPVPHIGRRDEVGAMADTLEVFKRGMLDAERLRAAQEDSKRQAEEQRRREMNRLADDFESQVEGVVQHVASASTEMSATASTMSAAADQARRQATAVAAAAEQASVNVQTVAAAAGQLRESIGEIGRQIARSTETTQGAVVKAQHTNAMVGSLAEAAQRIGDVVALINDIAGQTNLLALNATIEAARAGEAGKGFAVVASEVKSLANQTGRATEEIAQQIAAVQDATKQAVGAIRDITATIASVNETSSSIASAVEEQQAATSEISRNVEQAARGTQEVATNIAGVSQAAQEAAHAAEQVLNEASELSRQSELLDKGVVGFIAKVRAG
ncbi:HAMP domain-containing methyl-accepting chemotaxis protein [Azospirillum canadense]|uniref:HAMP domain-containing methyl-accepting chemotaxis protein n=1 Tax=Azospirillum canadense TaxID=403962 RepID=UPI00222647ED|nr:methyl-accepting chemotaxis protein [Azospirillum canadense]MCW2243336.1 methyl-accepting chemotaxis protein/CHASE3 domain sensor protein [Azospirillum canadense]